MVNFYRTVNSLGLLLGVNIAARIFSLPVENLMLSNHLVEAMMVFAAVSILIDLRIINSDVQKNYIKIGLITFFLGIIFVSASFSSLFVLDSFMEITKAWFLIAPQLIILISLPALYVADKLTYKQKIFGILNTGKRGLLNIFVLATAYSTLMIYILFKYGWLML